MPQKKSEAVRLTGNLERLTALYRRWMQYLRKPDKSFESFHHLAIEELRASGFRRATFDSALFPSLSSELRLAGNIQLAALPVAWNTPADINNVANTPLEKLLVAYLWKRGDLWKFARLLEGIRNVEVPALGDSDRAVMNQFGRYLCNPLAEPIFDQHTARHMLALAHLRGTQVTLKTFRTPSEGQLCKENKRREYKIWWLKIVRPAIELASGDGTEINAMLWADRTMFSLGKALSAVKSV
jgi:hypothetical protein